jgi:hypothetical protein
MTPDTPNLYEPGQQVENRDGRPGVVERVNEHGEVYVRWSMARAWMDPRDIRPRGDRYGSEV